MGLPIGLLDPYLGIRESEIRPGDGAEKFSI
ncbi:hypothetical protein DM43_4311 [Burkholderia cepacia]|uniref:Uncharacterized protein n=1 Tax=Burkholderia cepacia TaxID=292 RepID=A0AA88Z722_BURCE|nr:hypothetical protein DM43_4311 [Burkholderia cepacia]